MSEWQPIETLDKSKPHYVIVHEDGAMRMVYWEPTRECWTQPDPPFHEVVGVCARPTQWMPLPSPPTV
jgi:hypothetical protein